MDTAPSPSTVSGLPLNVQPSSPSPLPAALPGTTALPSSPLSNQASNAESEAETKEQVVYCNCGEPAKHLTCKNGQNAGREFYSCSQRQRNPVTMKYEGGCSYFKWQSEIHKGPSISKTQAKQLADAKGTKTPGSSDAVFPKPPPPQELKVVKTRTLLQEASDHHRFEWMPEFENVLRQLPGSEHLYLVHAPPYMMTYYYVHLMSWRKVTQQSMKRYCLRDRTPPIQGLPPMPDHVWIMLHGTEPDDTGWLYSPYVTHIVWPNYDNQSVHSLSTSRKITGFSLVPRLSLLRYVVDVLLPMLTEEERQPKVFDASDCAWSDPATYPVKQVFRSKDPVLGYRQQILVPWSQLVDHCHAWVLEAELSEPKCTDEDTEPKQTTRQEEGSMEMPTSDLAIKDYQQDYQQDGQQKAQDVGDQPSPPRSDAALVNNEVTECLLQDDDPEEPPLQKKRKRDSQ